MKDFHVFVSATPHANIDLCFVAMWFVCPLLNISGFG